MNIFKKRLSLILSLVMVALVVLPVFIVSASSDIAITVKIDGEKMNVNDTYVVEGGETIELTTSSADVTVTTIAYSFDGKTVNSIYQSSGTFTVPTGTPGTSRNLMVAAAGRASDGSAVQPDWITYKLKYKTDEVENKEVTVKYDSEVLAVKSTTNVIVGDSVSIKAEPTESVDEMYFRWDEEKWQVVYDRASYVVDFPASFTEGSTHYLYVRVKYNDGEITETQAYKFNMMGNEPQVSMVVTLDGKVMQEGNTYEVEGGETIKAVAESTMAKMEKVGYYYKGASNNIVDQKGNTLIFTVPTGTPGTTKTVYIEAVAANDDGSANTITKTGWIPFILKYAEEEVIVPSEKDVEVRHNNKLLTNKSTTSAEQGDTIKITATPENEVAGLYYLWDDAKVWNLVKNASSTSIIIPMEFEDDSTHALYVTAKYDDGTTADAEVYYFKMPAYVAPVEKDINVVYDGKTLANKSTISAEQGALIRITATPEDKVAKLFYAWDSTSVWNQFLGMSTVSLRIPTNFAPGSTHTLYVKSLYDDGRELGIETYYFKMPAESTTISMNVKLDSLTMTDGKTYEVEGDEEINVVASATNSTVKYIKYQFASESAEYVYKTKAYFDVPEGKVGTTKKLYIEAVAEDGTTTGTKTYTLKYVDNKDGELDIEPWNEENDEITQLSIALRNDSEEEEKANKNIYELNEVVTYFIDYKNGTDEDIDSKVSILLELPNDFTVVERDDGIVNYGDNEIEWVFEDGLEEGEAGTLVVKVKYTKMSKSKYDSEVIYPIATIFKGSKAKDNSAVINMLVTSYDEEIDCEHEPYMFGDAGADTFRPDDTITRAEGALVLARIYGINYDRIDVSTSQFTDLNQTYPEAQKAIIAATNAGLISGNTDGTYRPNEKMTRAQFMKVLACMIQKTAEEEEIEGLEIKELDEAIKVYADSEKYYIVDGKKVYIHWALEEVSLLARLNMTALSEENDEIELDEYISRAEVAQLVNFYLLRAPANVTSKTKSGFSDVSKKHELFADIIEATRDEHTFSIDSEDGTEIAE